MEDEDAIGFGSTTIAIASSVTLSTCSYCILFISLYLFFLASFDARSYWIGLW